MYECVYIYIYTYTYIHTYMYVYPKTLQSSTKSCTPPQHCVTHQESTATPRNANAPPEQILANKTPGVEDSM